jgi:hypothetical protein
MLAEGDQVWVRVTTRGSHSGEFEGLAPTGKQWTNTGIVFYRLIDGRITGSDILFDVYGQLKQLGATLTVPVPTTKHPLDRRAGISPPRSKAYHVSTGRRGMTSRAHYLNGRCGARLAA